MRKDDSVVRQFISYVLQKNWILGFELAATPLIFLWNFFARRFALFSPPAGADTGEEG